MSGTEAGHAGTRRAMRLLATRAAPIQVAVHREAPPDHQTALRRTTTAEQRCVAVASRCACSGPVFIALQNALPPRLFVNFDHDFCPSFGTS
eukprot:2944630-Rhodomonas_salina.1